MNMHKKLSELCEKFNIDVSSSFNTSLNKEIKISNEYRLIMELYYAISISKIKSNKYDELINEAVDRVYLFYLNNGAITKDFLSEIEESLKSINKDAKAYSVICVGHAHIDMNWLWGFNETVSITHDTFRTVLDLMKLYPEFTYAQSQASVYQIMEEYFPEMIEEVKARIKEGRWEVTASTWVEADRNMPNEESIARHLLYTKKYLSELLDISPKSLNIDFEPDTFGHNANTPEVLSSGGVKYYYHCRGSVGETLYRWYSKSGSMVISFREPLWYNRAITGHTALILADFCNKHNIDSLLCTYGIGDHGGGPTRRDIERIMAMNFWPIFPNWRFGTYNEFFYKADKIADQLPKVEGELNHIFTGCYTSQSLIKKNNKLTELAIKKCEMWNTIANNIIGTSYKNSEYEKNWRKVMFNHFHDILPGSGVAATREHASGLAQEVLAFTDTGISKNLRAISDNINTLGLVAATVPNESISQGAGVGFMLNEKCGVQYSRHSGSERIFTIFNSLPYKRKELAEVTLWDWQSDNAVFKDSKGNVLSHQRIKMGRDRYWGHNFSLYLVEIEVGPTGYETIIAGKENIEYPIINFEAPRKLVIQELKIENEYLKITFDDQARIISFIDKESNIDFAKNNPVGLFSLISEDAADGMTSWVIGRYIKEQNLNDNVIINNVEISSEVLRQSISCKAKFGNSSSLDITISLDKRSRYLSYDVKCRWQEIGSKETGVPQLQFNVPLSYDCSEFSYDIPLGFIDYGAMKHDVPAQSFAMAKNSEGKSVALICDCRYGYRGNENGLAVNLLRSSFDPDPLPEIGEHKFIIAIALVVDTVAAKKQAQIFCERFNSVSATEHGGKLKTGESFIKIISGNAIITAFKVSENDPDKMVLRLYNIDPSQNEIELCLFENIASAYFADINENVLEGDICIEGNCMKLMLNVEKIYTVLLKFK